MKSENLTPESQSTKSTPSRKLYINSSTIKYKLSDIKKIARYNKNAIFYISNEELKKLDNIKDVKSLKAYEIRGFLSDINTKKAKNLTINNHKIKKYKIQNISLFVVDTMKADEMIEEFDLEDFGYFKKMQAEEIAKPRTDIALKVVIFIFLVVYPILPGSFFGSSSYAPLFAISFIYATIYYTFRYTIKPFSCFGLNITLFIFWLFANFVLYSSCSPVMFLLCIPPSLIYLTINIAIGFGICDDAKKSKIELKMEKK